ncbi:MAG: hypothetical protein QOI38_1680 [Sphingomonadales bacterium]|nr:hypothetical protein [Sphingomonadales bacterium]
MIAWLIQNPDQTNALAAVGSAVMGALALVVAGLSIYFTARGLSLQRRHNRLSVRPIPFIALSKHDGIAIVLENHGLGPFKIDLFEIVRSGVVLQNIVEILPDNPPAGVTVTFTTGMWERTLPTTEKIEIVKVLINRTSSEAVAYLNQCRSNLEDTVIKIGYSDMYNASEQYHKDLDWLCKT